MFHIATCETHPEYPPHVSPACKSFLDACFQQDPKRRPTADALLRHPFLKAKLQAKKSAKQLIDRFNCTDSMQRRSSAAASELAVLATGACDVELLGTLSAPGGALGGLPHAVAAAAGAAASGAGAGAGSAAAVAAAAAATAVEGAGEDDAVASAVAKAAQSRPAAGVEMGTGAMAGAGAGAAVAAGPSAGPRTGKRHGKRRHSRRKPS